MKQGFLKAAILLAGLILTFTGWAQYAATPNGHFIEANGANIYYEEYGQGEPLILLHGFGRTLEDWKPFIAEYSKSYRVLAWDMRGHGRSSNPDTSAVFLHTTAAKDLLLFIEKMKLGKVRVIGHSSGGIILLQAAIIAPDLFESIVTLSAQTFFSPQIRDFIKHNAKPEDYTKFNELEEQHGIQKGAILAKQFYHFHELKGDPEISQEALKTIKSHTFIIHGDNDFVPVSQAWGLFQNIPKARLWIVPNGWHLPHVGQTNTPDFIRQTLAFMRGEWNTEETQNDR